MRSPEINHRTPLPRVSVCAKLPSVLLFSALRVRKECAQMFVYAKV